MQILPFFSLTQLTGMSEVNQNQKITVRIYCYERRQLFLTFWKNGEKKQTFVKTFL